MISREQYYYLRQLDDFRYFSIDEFDHLVSAVQFRKAKKKQILFYREDNRDKLFLLVSGYVKFEQADRSGNFLYTDFVKRDSIFPCGDLFSETTYHFLAVAMTDIEYFTIPVDLYESYSLGNRYQMKHLYTNMSRILEFHEIRLRNMVTSSAQTRVIQSLALLLVEMGDDEKLPFTLTTIDIANLSGTTRETVSRVLGQLKEKGVLSLSHKYLCYEDKDYFLQYIT
ncbi:Crp/Fnr family transcriptional regulator [Streptococcus sp. zg-JUN1979]|uniref:Crp/Fnr family transcriptional regulator n=1 Tax=Streptococcus sp. zg-JUN1979 TaxID=3391450 RepID=UPI0039A4F91F